MPDNLVNRRAVALNLPSTPIVGDVPAMNVSATDMWKNTLASTRPAGVEEIPLASIYSGDRYDATRPGTNYEEMFGQQQDWGSKMVHSVGKGLVLTGTTFLQTTAGLANGIFKMIQDGRLASFYDNELNRSFDNLNKHLEDSWANYYTDAEKAAHWYSPSKLFSANFLWDGIVKNLGFAAGAMLSGGVFAMGLKGLSALPGLSKLFSVGKGAEALAATEEALVGVNSAGKAAATYGKVKSLSDKFLGAYSTLNTGQRITVAGLATTGEAGFEAYNNMNQFRDGKIQEYKDTHNGFDPTGEDLEKINRESDSVGNWSFLFNTALLTATNYIQFPKILGSSYTIEKGQINSLTREIGKISGKAGAYAEKPLVGGKILGTLNRIRPYTFSASEGFEEGAQYAITKGTQDYYDKKYKNQDNDFMDSIIEGIHETISTDEGMENVLIGGLSGAMMLGIGKYKQASRKAQNTTDAIKAFNERQLSDFTKDTRDAVNRGVVIQQEREELLKAGNISDSKDKEADYIINYLAPRIKYGRLDLVRSEIDTYRQLAATDEGFSQLQSEGKALQTDTKEAYLKRLSALEATAENVKSLYQSLHLRYGSQLDEKGKPIYSSAVMDKMVYAASKVADYDVRIPSLFPKLVGNGVNTDEVIRDILDGKNDKFDAAIAHIDGLNILDEEKTILKESLGDVAIMTLRRDKFLKEYADIKNSPVKHQEQMVENKPAVPGEEKKINIKTKTGDKELTIGKEYFIGKGFDYDKTGLETPVTISKLTIIEENPDGTIKIKDNQGKVRDISKDELLDYKITPVEQLKANKTANYFFTHRADVFEINLGKKYGGKKAARIEYKDGKLFIVYKGLNGKLVHKSVDNSFFVKQKGFDQPRIKVIGKVRNAEEQRAHDEFISAEELEKQKQTAAQNRDTRIEILTQLFDDISNEQVSNEKLVAQKKIELENIIKELSALEEQILNAQDDVDKRFKKITFKSTTRKALATATRLEKMQSQLEQEIATLQARREELDIDLSYISDMAQNIDELPTNSKEFLNELRDHKTLLEDMILNTSIEIESVTGILDKVKAALDSAIDFLADLVHQFQKKFPKVPLILGQEWIDFLQLNPNFLKRKSTYKEELKQLDDLVAQVEDLDIIPGERTIKELNEKLSELQESLLSYEKELKVSGAIIARFEEIAKASKEKKAEEKLLDNNKKLIKEALGVSAESIQTRKFDEDYEPEAKKSVELIGISTVTTGDKPHAIRSNRFGVNLNKFPNRKNIRGVYVTFNNEDQLIPGLIDHLRTDEQGNIDESINREEFIVLVMTDENGSLVDVNGEVLPEDADKINNAIYQVFPESKLAWSAKYGNATMFRKGTPQTVIDAVTEQYGKWRDNVLQTTTDLSNIHEIDASFGFPEYVTYKDDKGNDVKVYTTQTSVQDAGLITNDDLEKGIVIRIPTTNEINEQGSTSFETPLGRVFLELPNALTPLQNRKHTKAEAQTIYQAIIQLARNMLDPKEGIHSDNSDQLFNYLRSVVYWGIPTDQDGNRKPAGYNSIFWEVDETTGKFMLTMSGKGKDFVFSPSSLEQNKEDILLLLEKMYNNINSSMVKSMEAYPEVISINSDGTLNTRLWVNYQAYLLANKFMAYDNKHPKNGESRNTDIPLSTPMRPLKDKEDVNRTGVYFYTTDTADDIKIPTVTKTVTTNLVPGAPKPKSSVSPAIVKPGEMAVFTSEKGKQLKFIITPKLNKDNFETEISILQGADVEELKKVVTDAGYDPKRVLKKRIFDAIASQLTEEEEEMESITIPEDTKEDRINAIKNAKVGDIFSIRGVDRRVTDITKRGDVVFEGEPLPFSKDILIEQIERQEETPLPTNISNEVDDTIESYTITDDDIAERVVIEQEINVPEIENWDEVESWLKTNFPNVPVYRVKNIIQTYNNKKAWGMLKDGAIYLYESAEVGTVYHEVFEAVWKAFTPVEEQVSIINEFKSRKGTFTDRPTGKQYEYSSKEVTPQMVKEQLAEEFRSYIKDGKIPNKPEKGKPFILKLFSDLVNFIKEFFTGKKAISNTEELFRKIGTGYYKNNAPYSTVFSFAKQGLIDIEDAFATPESELSLVGISDKQRSEIIQEMTYQTLKELIVTDKSLFTIPSLEKTDLYTRLKKEILKTVARKVAVAKKMLSEKKITQQQFNNVRNSTAIFMQSIVDQWSEIVSRQEEYLRGYSIEFDENDILQVNDQNKTKGTDYVDSTKIDSFKKANSAIKLLLATIPKVDAEEHIIRSTIGGVTLLPISQTYINLMNTLHSSKTVDEMMKRLHNLAIEDVNYRTLYKRITKNTWRPKGESLNNITEVHGAQLLGAFWKTFKKQNPSVKNVFIYENGEVVVGDANLSTAATQLREEYKNAIILAAKSGTSYYVYNEKEKAYVGDPTKVKSVRLDTLTSYSEFLKKLGISFTVPELQKLATNTTHIKEFKEAVSGIRNSIAAADKIATFSYGQVLKINGRLLELAIAKSIITTPDFESTFFNVTGDRTQSFIGVNPADALYNFLSSIEKFNSVNVDNSEFRYLRKDAFSQGSNILKRMFTSEGSHIKGSEELLRVGYVSGISNEKNGKHKSSARLTYKERLIQEINLNLKGWFLNLVPGDATTEWMIQMGNPISPSSISRGMTEVNTIFREYFISELDLVREDRKVHKNRNTNEMRFFKDILGETLHNEIIRNTKDTEEVYSANENKINSALEKFINKNTDKFQKELSTYGILVNDEKGFTLQDISLSENMSEQQLSRELKSLTVNFMIANIEMHKLLYADPYQYSQELKRIKNFNSPRQQLINNSPEMNALFNKVWNEGFIRGDIGWTNFQQDYFKTATHKDVQAVIDLLGYTEYDETDGSGIIEMSANRHFRIRAGEWNDNEERQYRYDIAWEKRDKGQILSPKELEILEKNPGIASAYTPIKPIVAGNRLNSKGTPNDINDIVLDKYALYPLSYRIMKELNPTANVISLYNKMQKEKIDYVIFESGRKVGARNPHDTYNENGEFNNTPYTKENIINVPFSIMSVQSEVPSKDVSVVTRGSQVTKLLTMDFMEAGVPIDFEGKDFATRYKNWYKLSEEEKEAKSPLYKEIKTNQRLLEQLMEEGYNSLLRRMGITEKNGKFVITDFSDVVKTLREEILKREVNDNVSDALTSFLEGKSVLEATPVGQQVKNILYSIADKEIISPTISGGLKVQIPSTLLESVKARKETINGKEGYTSDVLEFYKDEDGKRVCEIMVARWFNSNKTDEELLEYLNNSEEGRKILSGLAFRIPTQNNNSIDAIVIKKFLPKEFSDSVVVPSALVQKTGSDFDIDKLSIYLKNIYRDAKGNEKLLPFYGFGDQAINKFEQLYYDELEAKLDILDEKHLKQTTLQNLFGDIALGIASEKTENKWIPIFKKWFSDEVVDGKLSVSKIEDIFIQRIEKLNKKIDKLNDVDIQEILASEISERWYKQSLENEYIQSSQNLVSHPLNFKRLVKPNSSKDLQKLAEFIAGEKSFDYNSVGNMLDRSFMSSLRHAFVSGKQAIGIAAVNQTNHSLNQRQPIYINNDRFDKLSDEDKWWLSGGTGNKEDAVIKFDKFNKIEIDGKMYATLSMIANTEGKDISDIISQFIDGYVDIANKGPWIMQLGATPNVASTWLFLVKIGVPIDTVVYFMNQPIIHDYLNKISNAGYSWLFIDSYLEEIQKEGRFAIDENDYASRNRKSLPNKSVLKENVHKTEFNKQEKIEQHFILQEFLKYAKMANHMFLVTQGSNFDTANFNDPYLVFKKFTQLEKAQNTIISSVDDILENSFLGKLGYTITKMRDALAEILKSDQKTVRGIVQKVLTPYVDMNDDDFIKLSQKVVNDLFDYAVQTGGSKLNADIRSILINNGGVATEAMKFVNQVKANISHPLHDNEIIKLISAKPSPRADVGGVNNIKIKGKDNKTYDQNNIIYAFRELKQYLGDNPLYEKIKLLGILQSGLSNSALSFTSLLPYEDFAEVYNKILSKIESVPNLENFYTLNIFQRNNWGNDDIIPYLRAKLKVINGRSYYNPSMNFLDEKIKNAVRDKKIPPVMTLSTRNREANSDFIVFTWEKQEELLTEAEKAQANKDGIRFFQAVNIKKANMRKIGDYSFINKGLFKKVYYENSTEPLYTEDKKGNPYFVYKAINAWGDSYRANEFYETDHVSVIENGFIKTEDVNNNTIISLFNNEIKTLTQQKNTPPGLPSINRTSKTCQ